MKIADDKLLKFHHNTVICNKVCSNNHQCERKYVFTTNDMINKV